MFSSKVFLLIALVIIFVISALSVIAYKYQSRSLFIAIQKQEKMLDDSEVEWGQLQLELTTLTEENRIEHAAIEQLKLRMPGREEIVYIKP